MDITKLEKLQPKVTKNGKTRSQIGRSSKTKGKTGERYFADKLSEASGKSFIRVPNSGAFVGQSNRDRLKTLSRTQSLINLGDIICPEELKRYFIFEVKNYKSMDFHNLINPGGSKQLLKWLDELLYDIESATMFVKQKEVIGFLCVKITNKGNWIIGNASNIAANWRASIPYPCVKFVHSIPDTIKNDAAHFGEKFFMCSFESFIKYNKEMFEESI